MNRKPTEPGLPAPPAPGSVGPTTRPPVPRRVSPGAYAYTAEDDVPTRPDPDPQARAAASVAGPSDLIKLGRFIDCLPEVERRRFFAMVNHYASCSRDRRVILEETAREFAVKGSQ